MTTDKPDTWSRALALVMLGGAASLLCDTPHPPRPAPSRAPPATSPCQEQALAAVDSPEPAARILLPREDELPLPTDTHQGAAARGLRVPEKPFKSQKKPPCSAPLEAAINGGCWVKVELKPARDICPGESYFYAPPGGEGGCYLPVGQRERTPTSVEEAR